VKVAGDSLYIAGYSGTQAVVARYSVSNGALVTDFAGGVVVGNSCDTDSSWSPAFALVIQSFARGIGVYIRKPVIVGTCMQ
jgi:hypothetical protein